MYLFVNFAQLGSAHENLISNNIKNICWMLPVDSAAMVDVTSPPTFFVVVAAVGSAPEIQNQN